jgi:hypothetical protein
MQGISISLKTSRHLAAGHDFQQIYYLSTNAAAGQSKQQKHTD